MKTGIRGKRVALAVMALLAASPCLGVPTISLLPQTQTVMLGTPFTVDLLILGLGNGVALGAFDLNLDLVSTDIVFVGATFGAQLDLFSFGDLQSVTVTAGRVQLLEVSFESSADLLALQPANFRLASITFDTLASTASSPLTLSLNALGDAAGAPLSATVLSGAVTISPVPESSALAMMLAGSALLASLLSRRRQQAV